MRGLRGVLRGPRDHVRAAADRGAVGQLQDRELLLPAHLLELRPPAGREQAERPALAVDDLLEVVAVLPERFLHPAAGVGFGPSFVYVAHIQLQSLGDAAPPFPRMAPPSLSAPGRRTGAPPS